MYTFNLIFLKNRKWNRKKQFMLVKQPMINSCNGNISQHFTILLLVGMPDNAIKSNFTWRLPLNAIFRYEQWFIFMWGWWPASSGDRLNVRTVKSHVRGGDSLTSICMQLLHTPLTLCTYVRLIRMKILKPTCTDWFTASVSLCLEVIQCFLNHNPSLQILIKLVYVLCRIVQSCGVKNDPTPTHRYIINYSYYFPRN